MDPKNQKNLIHLRYSVIIFTRNEPCSIRKAIDAILSQIKKQNTELFAELLVVAPDKETCDIVHAIEQKLAGNPPVIRFIQDKGIGKPAALNLVMTRARGDICVLTDGDVVIQPGALKALLSHFIDLAIGAVSGHPIPRDSRNTKYGFWAHLLTQAGAHRVRTEASTHGKIIECSGYLMAFRKNLFTPIPEDALSDDPVISHVIWSKKQKIAYASDAKVMVKYPDNFSDWKKQKIRGMAGYHQGYLGNEKMRSGFKESAKIGWAFKYAHGARELWWTVQLIFARIYVWFAAMWYIKVLKKDFNEVWTRVESTK